MAENITDVMVTGIRNAHALEAQAIQILERQAQRLTDYPELQSRITMHLDESRQQQAMLDELLGKFGTGGSTLKNAALGLAANVQAMMHSAAEDEVLKNSFASYAFEHFEIASYRALITMARQAGNGEVERVATQILRQEEQMAQWLGDHLDELTRQYLVVQGHATPAGSQSAGAALS